MAGRPTASKKVKLDNGSGVPAPVQPSHPPPQPYPQYVPWPQAGRGAIPIDPALQGHPPPPPPGYAYPQYMPPPGAQPHFPPGAYAFPYHAPPVPQQAAAPRPAQPAASSSTGGGGGDLHDVSTLNDSLASAGVDLRAEEENLTKSAAGNHKTWNIREDRTKRAAVVDTRALAQTINNVAKHHGLAKGAQDDAVQYVAHALRARMEALLTAMLAAAQHRTEAQVTAPPGVYDPHETGTPMWDNQVRRDVALQLAAIEKAEREEEMRVRKERRERQEAHAAQLAALNAPQGANGGGGDDDEPKRKKKKEGPGVAARNMSEDVRKKMSNAVASHAAGLGKKYAWMTDGAAAAPAATPSKPKPKADTPTPSTPAPSTPAASGWAKPYVPAGKSATPSTPTEPEQRRLTLRDAMFVIEHERGHGGGRGAAKGWT